jgi:hypothetical protein
MKLLFCLALPFLSLNIAYSAEVFATLSLQTDLIFRNRINAVSTAASNASINKQLFNWPLSLGIMYLYSFKDNPSNALHGVALNTAIHSRSRGLLNSYYLSLTIGKTYTNQLFSSEGTNTQIELGRRFPLGRKIGFNFGLYYRDWGIKNEKLNELGINFLSLNYKF